MFLYLCCKHTNRHTYAVKDLASRAQQAVIEKGFAKSTPVIAKGLTLWTLLAGKPAMRDCEGRGLETCVAEREDSPYGPLYSQNPESLSKQVLQRSPVRVQILSVDMLNQQVREPVLVRQQGRMLGFIRETGAQPPILMTPWVSRNARAFAILSKSFVGYAN